MQILTEISYKRSTTDLVDLLYVMLELIAANSQLAKVDFLTTNS